MKNFSRKSYDIAVDNLRSCYGKEGIFAGKNHFRNYWARDSFYGSLGSLLLGDFDIVKKNLELFIKYSKKDSFGRHIPLRIGDYNILFSFFGFHSNKLIPRYSQDKGNNAAYDPNPLFLISLYHYLKISRDRLFLESYKNKIKEIVDWIVNQIDFKTGLIWSGKYATWHDSIKKEGFTLYNNILCFEALRCSSIILNSVELKELSLKLKNSINLHFWDKWYYHDFITENKKISVFSTFENTLAIIFGISSKSQSHSIERYILNSDINKVVPSLTNYQRYSKKEESLRLRIFGMGDYHNHSVAWLFIGLSDAMAKNKISFTKESEEELESISNIIEKFGKVYECYETKGKNIGKPLKRFFYSSEENFAISSSFYILAYNQIINKKRLL